MMKRLAMLPALLLTASLLTANAQTTGTTAAHKKTKKTVKHQPEAASAAQLRELREQMQAQIDALKSQLAARDVQVTTAQQSATDAATQAAAAKDAAAQATAAASVSSSKVDALQTNVTDLKSVSASLTDTVVTEQKTVKEAIESPTALHYKGITITPVAFFAFEGVWRQRSVNSDINTPLNSIPFPGANEGHVSELNFSGRQTRLGGLFEGNAGPYKLSGYFESDFFGAGTTSNNNQSNSYVLRQRQLWGRFETKTGFAVTGGQMWSLVAEDGKYADNRTEKLPNTIDPQYVVGFSWARQPALRLTQRFGDAKTGAFTMAMSVEQAQITNFTAATGSGALPTQYFFGGVGQNGGLYNAAGNVGAGNTAGTGGLSTYANNIAPDVLVKGAVDFAKAHFELGGIARFLRDYYYPVTTTGTSAAPVYTYATNLVSHTSPAGGVFGSARVSPSKFADIAVQGMAGYGVGRYGTSQLADATLRPDETLAPIHNYHGLFALETHPTPKLDIYTYYGGEYAQRTVYTNPVGTLMGYGTQNLNDGGCYNLPPAVGTAGTGGNIATGTNPCASPTRYIQEGMLGMTYRAVNSPKYGRLQYQLTYSLIQRNLWSGLGSATTPTGPRAQDSMIHAGMRYYIP